jgi:hypothetical protein
MVVVVVQVMSVGQRTAWNVSVATFVVAVVIC